MDFIKKSNEKNHRTNLICVVCEGFATGYNFSQICCQSCKEFFRRSILSPKNKIKCLNPTNSPCSIRYNIKPKCQQCRLLKCIEMGMRKDLIQTNQDKQSRRKLLEQNRYFYLKQNQDIILTDADRIILEDLKHFYTSALQASPLISSIISFDSAHEKPLSIFEATEIDGLAVIRVINFIRKLPEFQSLNEHDRFALVKSNFSMLFALHDTLIFDPIYEVWNSNNGLPFNPTIDEDLAQNCRSLFIVVYGYDIMKKYIKCLRRLKTVIGNDSIIVQLLMIILIHLPGVLNNLNQLVILVDSQHIFHTHCKYVDLLFRYLIEQFSFDFATKKIMQIIEEILHIQKVDQDFQDKFRNKLNSNHIHPLLSSVLNL